MSSRRHRLTDSRTGRAPGAGPARYWKLAVFLLAVAAVNFAGAWFARELDFQLFPRHERLLHSVVLGAALLFVVLMATPFMPGIEIGLALMLMLGAKGALLVYACTIAALSLSFALGRTLPPRALRRFLDWLHLRRASALVGRLEPLSPPERLAFLHDKLPARIAPLLVHHRYVAVAVALNIPGNALIGGGGGIGLAVGMSRIVPFHAYLLVVALAVAPVPAWFYLHGG